MEQSLPLCSPNEELSCFGCCPPIRPARYDHIDHVAILKREFAENRRLLKDEGPAWRPIVGYSCWALGFLDGEGRRVGCLLHPQGNGGRDLRYLIDYEDKCRRESCLAARAFAALPPEGRSFWLPLAYGMSPFFFSSPRANPLFHLLLWGREVLEAMRDLATREEWSVTELLWRRRFLLNRIWNPRGDRFFFRTVIERLAEEGDSLAGLEACCMELRTAFVFAQGPSSSKGAVKNAVAPDAPYTHSLPMDADFLDCLRITLNRSRISFDEAMKIHKALGDLAGEIMS